MGASISYRIAYEKLSSVGVKMKRRFSRPPQVSSNSRANENSPHQGISTAVQEFKATFIFERRTLEQFRTGKPSNYKPALSYDGKSRWDTPEEKPSKVNAWKKCFDTLNSNSDVPSPKLYVRILFKILRESSLATPTLPQLTSPNMLGLVSEFLQDVVTRTRQQFVAESQRAEKAIRVNQKGSGYPFALAVYYAIADSRVGLSPLYKYCLATAAYKKLESSQPDSRDSVNLKALAKEYELMAAMDYCCLPQVYDKVWGDVIPENFRVAACGYVDSAINKQKEGVF
jgi:hypothetical protein